jgi:hypothetical protein
MTKTLNDILGDERYPERGGGGRIGGEFLLAVVVGAAVWYCVGEWLR